MATRRVQSGPVQDFSLICLIVDRYLQSNLGLAKSLKICTAGSRRLMRWNQSWFQWVSVKNKSYSCYLHLPSREVAFFLGTLGSNVRAYTTSYRMSLWYMSTWCRCVRFRPEYIVLIYVREHLNASTMFLSSSRVSLAEHIIIMWTPFPHLTG